MGTNRRLHHISIFADSCIWPSSVLDWLYLVIFPFSVCRKKGSPVVLWKGKRDLDLNTKLLVLYMYVFMKKLLKIYNPYFPDFYNDIWESNSKICFENKTYLNYNVRLELQYVLKIFLFHFPLSHLGPLLT